MLILLITGNATATWASVQAGLMDTKVVLPCLSFHTVKTSKTPNTQLTCRFAYGGPTCRVRFQDGSEVVVVMGGVRVENWTNFTLLLYQAYKHFR
jgi:hypothetical protein